MGIVTVWIDGLWERIKSAYNILVHGETTFAVEPENFIEEGVRPDKTTCIYVSAVSGDEAFDDHVCVGDPPDLSQ